MRLTFDGFDIDTQAGQLFCAGKEVPLEPRALGMLCYLAAHPDRLVTKDELLAEVWRAQTLSDGVLSNSAAKLRKALGQATGARTPIETVRGRGFRWRARRLGVLPAAPAHPDPFVGRKRVLEVLERALERAGQGDGQVVLLSGCAGIGKTRTLDELARGATARGFSVWQGAAHEGAGAPPYWLWTEILRSAHADLSNAMFRRHTARDSWAMSVLVPELVRVDPSAHSTDAQATRFRLFDEVARFITSASGDAPRLIIADDVHWADDGTLELLAYVARALHKRAVVLAVSLRDPDPTQAPARSAALARLGRHATHVPLAGLSLDEVADLVAALGELPRVGASWIDVLYERTQGNPFFVRQTLALLARGSQPVDHESLGRLALPQAVRDVLRQRCDGLGAEARSVLQMAAAVGADFDAGLLADVLERPLANVLAALDLARSKGVVVSHDVAAGRFGFSHALLREVIYDDLALVTRGGLHARLAHVLGQRPAGNDARALGEIARHYLLAVPPALDVCVRHCRSAAAAARHALGFEAAAELLSRASDKLASEGGDPRTRCELLLELGGDRFRVGDVRNAWRALEQGAAIAEQIGATELFARFACQLASWLELGGGDEELVRKLLERALQAVGATDSDLRAALIAHRVEICFELPASERRALLDEADRLAAQHSEPLTLIDVAMCRASLRDPTRPDESHSAIERARELIFRHGSELPVPHRLLAHFAIDLGEYLRAITACDLAAADAAIERCRRVAQESQVLAVALSVDLMRAGRALGDGRLDDLANIVRRTLGANSLAGGFERVFESYALRLVEAQGGLASLAGFDDALPSFDELRPSQRMNAVVWVARMNAKIGTPDTLERARRALAGIRNEQLACMPSRYGDLGMLCFLAEIYAELRDAARAATLYPQLLPYAGLNAVLPTFDYAGAVAYYLGILARLLGRDDQAARHFAQAAEIDRQLGCVRGSGRRDRSSRRTNR